jgi:hypothetical protein
MSNPFDCLQRLVLRTNWKFYYFCHILRWILVFYPINLDEYYGKEIDEREILTGYNFALIPETLQNVPLFTAEELILLNGLHHKFSENIAQLSDFEYEKD